MKKFLFIVSFCLSVLMGANAAVAYDVDLTATDKEYFVSIRDGILQDRRQWVADQINYPLLCSLNGHKTRVKTRKQFLRHYDEIINAYVLESLRWQKPDKLFKNWQGMMVGRGAIWFDQLRYEDKGPWVYRIYTINNDAGLPLPDDE